MGLKTVIQRVMPLRETAIWAALAGLLGYLANFFNTEIAGILALGVAGIAILVGFEALPRVFNSEPGAGKTGEIKIDGDIVQLVDEDSTAAVRISRLVLIAHWAGPPPCVELRQFDGARLIVPLSSTSGLLELEEALRLLDGYPAGRLHAALGDLSKFDDIIWESDDG